MKIHTILNRNGVNGFFAAANTRHGFFSLYDEIYSEEKLNRVLIIKGGPGTGKSTLMKVFAERALDCGYAVDVYLCSSDPASIDGVIVPSIGVAILDGTAPHTRDPIYPGACGQTLDLGRFWDHGRLIEETDTIKASVKSKSQAYSRAYRYLSAAGTANEDVYRGISGAFDRQKAKKAVGRLFEKHRLAESGKGSVRKIFTGAISTSGMGELDTLERLADTVYYVSGHHGAEKHLLDLIHTEALARGIAHTFALSPLSPEHTDSVYFDLSGVLFTLIKPTSIDAHTVNSKRFVDQNELAQIRIKLRISEKMKGILLDEAVSSLIDAGKYHAETESVYSAAMDFDSIRKMTDEIIGEVFG